MKNLRRLIIVLLLPFISLSQNDNLVDTLIESPKEFAVLTKDGVYEGYEKLSSWYFQTIFDIRLPKNYSYYFNINDFLTYVDKEEPNFFENFTKFANLSSSSKALYYKKHNEELRKIQEQYSKSGKIHFRRIILQSYLNDGLDNICTILKFSFRRQGYEPSSYSFHIPEWNRNLNKYSLLEEVESIKKTDDIDKLVNLNEELLKDLTYLRYLNYNKSLLDTDLVTLEEYDKAVLQKQKEYPGRFTDKRRLKIDRDKHIKKIETKKEMELARAKGLLDDVNFKLARIHILLSLLSDEVSEANYPNQWYLEQPKQIISYSPHIPEEFKNESYAENYMQLKPIGKINLVKKETHNIKSKDADLNTNITKTHKITVDNLRLRTSPNLGSETIDYLPINCEVQILHKSDIQTTVEIENNSLTEYWYKVKTPKGLVGWIHGCCFEK